MFEKKNNDRYFEGHGMGKADAYTRINEIIEQHADDDPKAVLTALKIICEYELMGNPYSHNVVLFKSEPKEL